MVVLNERRWEGDQISGERKQERNQGIKFSK